MKIFENENFQYGKCHVFLKIVWDVFEKNAKLGVLIAKKLAKFGFLMNNLPSLRENTTSEWGGGRLVPVFVYIHNRTVPIKAP